VYNERVCEGWNENEVGQLQADQHRTWRGTECRTKFRSCNVGRGAAIVIEECVSSGGVLICGGYGAWNEL
jgi:hypothetical protein